MNFFPRLIERKSNPLESFVSPVLLVYNPNQTSLAQSLTAQITNFLYISLQKQNKPIVVQYLNLVGTSKEMAQMTVEEAVYHKEESRTSVFSTSCVVGNSKLT